MVLAPVVRSKKGLPSRTCLRGPARSSRAGGRGPGSTARSSTCASAQRRRREPARPRALREAHHRGGHRSGGHQVLRDCDGRRRPAAFESESRSGSTAPQDRRWQRALVIASVGLRDVASSGWGRPRLRRFSDGSRAVPTRDRSRVRARASSSPRLFSFNSSRTAPARHATASARVLEFDEELVVPDETSSILPRRDRARGRRTGRSAWSLPQRSADSAAPSRGLA